MNKGYIIKFRKSKFFKSSIFSLVLTLLINFYPQPVYAVTDGAEQSEFSSFSQASTSEMVDPYTGDFKYNIPLLSVPGPNGSYPINLSYQSGISMEQEATWAGLGWNINVGAINRQLRGLPDDFSGDQIVHTSHLKPVTIVSYSIPFSLVKSKFEKQKHKEYFGIATSDVLNLSDRLRRGTLEVYYNTTKGLGFKYSIKPIQSSYGPNSVVGDLSYDSQSGWGADLNYSLNANFGSASCGVSLQTGRGISNFHVNTIASSKFGILKKEIQGSQSLSFSTNQNIPNVSIPMSNNVVPFQLRFGTAFTGPFFGYFKAEGFKLIHGYIYDSRVANRGITVSNAFGYNNTLGATDDNDMMDVSRVERAYTKKIPNLSPSFYNYDIYSYTAQGSGGVFRPYQSSIVTLGDRKQVSTTTTNSGTIEFGKGGAYHIGLGYSYGPGKTSSGRWNTGNYGVNPIQSRGYEQVYYKDMVEMAGDLALDDEYSKWLNKKAIRSQVYKENDGWVNDYYKLTNNLITSSSSNASGISGSPENITVNKRKPRGKHIRVYTYQESKQLGFTRFVNKANFSTKIQNHHTSEVEITQEDGMRYIYAIPAYIQNQVEYVSSINSNKNNLSKVADLKSDSYKDEETEEYLSRKDIPGYAHSWLLSYVVSSDYVDVNQNGPDAYDNGYWVKFNYDKTSDDYKWRSPYKGATYLEGNLSDDKDDKAMFTYGTKQLFYLSSVETKTHIALFDKSKRKDGKEANGVNGEFVNQDDAINDRGDNGSLFQLDKIRLYTQDEYLRIKNNSNGDIGSPLKTVNFTYTNELCYDVSNNIDNSQNLDNYGGKLTLKSLYFTYQNSTRGKLNPYNFYYENNLRYNPQNIDRWGNYKENENENKDAKRGNSYQYTRFPYTDQSFKIENGKKVSKNIISAWTLNKIDLPSGGTFNVEYESDDYAYVENKKATRMYEIVGVGDHTDNNVKVDYNNRVSLQKSSKLYFDLEEPITPNLLNLPSSSSMTQSQIDNYFIKNYIGDLDKIWFQTKIRLRTKSDQSDIDDMVSGFAEINKNNCGVIKGSDNQYSRGYISLNTVKLNEHGLGAIDVHPFAKQAIQFLQVERGELINDKSNTNSMSGKGVGDKILSFGKEAINFLPQLLHVFTGYNNFAYSILGTGKEIDLAGNTILKLQDSDGFKFGGGLRVKKISISDNWKNGSTSDVSNYGQEYDYTIEEDGRIISSGVAYEPQVGGEESSLRTPIDYKDQTLLGTTKTYYMENPLLEGYYPAAGVGYRKVTVKSIAPLEAKREKASNSLMASMAPITVYEFYTPKEFPVLTDKTDLSSDNTIRRPVIVPFVISIYNQHLARSQGYSIVLNDMAGKLKSVATYTRPTDGNLNAIMATLISSKRYIYHTTANYDDNKPNELKNEVDVYVPDDNGGVKLAKANIGQTIEVFIDQNQHKEESNKYGGEIDLDISTTGFPFMIMPTSDCFLGEKTQSFSVTMKIIHRKGILKEVIETTEKSVIKSENVVYDQLTSEALLTKVTNEFREPLYSMRFPGHWYYKDGLGATYERNGLEVKGSLTMSNGKVTGFNTSDDLMEIFSPGDEVFYTSVSGNGLAHVISRTVNTLFLVTNFGEKKSLSSITSIKIIHPSGKNNLKLDVGSITFKDYKETNGVPNFSKIINSSAITLSDNWLVPCNINGLQTSPNSYNNPYVIGRKGIFRPQKSYAYVTSRNYIKDISKDGTYSDFQLFPWTDLNNKSSKWVQSNETTLFSKLGYQIETKNALNIYSSSMYGYNDELPVAVSSNAQFKEIGFDGFEDYNPKRFKAHFGFQKYWFKVDDKESHSGRKSIKVSSGEKLKMKKAIGNCDNIVSPPNPIDETPNIGNNWSINSY